MASAPDRETWQEVKTLFAEVSEASPEEQERLLVDATNPRVVSEVRRLLVFTHTDGPLDQSALASISSDASWMGTSLVGRNIGAYRIVSEIGRGGMGTVYLGARDDGEFEQRVAIKILRLGVSSSAMSARFRQERQILAGLQHPHIAGLLDGGVTPDDIPYLVLEYIDGQPIDVYCEQQRLSIAARLDLFRDVLDAVAYAHRQLVVHRDLKPNNILVTRDGVVKLVDFGIAKLLNAADGEATMDGWQAFTTAYAAPEQVYGAQISTATDIYSLGVVLYELLSGKPPFDIGGRSAGDAMETIRFAEPPLPSTVVTREAATNRGLGTAERQENALRGELDAVVMMALRKEPSRRYQSASVFAEDLHAFLRGMPVSARADTFSYRVRKLIRRRWPIVIGGTIGLIALLAGTSIALWQARSARAEASRAALVSEYLQAMIGAADMSSESYGARLGPGASLSELLDSAASRMPVSLREDTRGRYTLHMAFGRAFRTQERYRDAALQFDSARAVARRMDGNESLSEANALRELGTVEADRGNYPRAQEVLAEARLSFERNDAMQTDAGLQLQTQIALADAMRGTFTKAESLLKHVVSTAARRHPGPSVIQATALAHLGGIYSSSGDRLPQADSMWRRAVAMFDALPNGNVVEKGDALWYGAIGEATHNNLARAESLSMAALAIYKRAAGPMSSGYAAHLANLAGMARARGDIEAATQYVDEAMRIMSARPESNPITRMRVMLEGTRLLFVKKEYGSAEKVARQIVADLKRDNTQYLAQAQVALGVILSREHKFGEAQPELKSAFQYYEHEMTINHPLTQAALKELVIVLDSTHDYQQAAEYRKRILSVAKTNR